MTIEEAAMALTELAELDPEAMGELVEARVACNDKLADHPRCTVVENALGWPFVGVMGLLNSLFATPTHVLAAIADENGQVHQFEAVPR